MNGIGPSFPRPGAPPRAKSLPVPEEGSCGLWETVKDGWTGAQFGVAAVLYKRASQLAEVLQTLDPPLRDVPSVAMQRPLVFVPGWKSQPEKFNALSEKLLDSGENGERRLFVKNGEFFEDSACRKPVPANQVGAGDKVFQLIFEDSRQSPDQTAPQIHRSLEAISGATGAQKVDALGYSMGGLATRKYLAEGGSKVGNLMLLGTPNQGTRFSVMAKRLIEHDVKWAMNLAGMGVGDLPALSWMSPASPSLSELNREWQQQRSQAEKVTVVGTDSFVTPKPGFLPLGSGDGLVDRASLDLPDVPVKIFRGKGYLYHGALPQDSQVYREMIGFFGWSSRE